MLSCQVEIECLRRSGANAQLGITASLEAASCGSAEIEVPKRHSVDAVVGQTEHIEMSAERRAGRHLRDVVVGIVQDESREIAAVAGRTCIRDGYVQCGGGGASRRVRQSSREVAQMIG